jgi:hypothetical protein
MQRPVSPAHPLGQKSATFTQRPFAEPDLGLIADVKATVLLLAKVTVVAAMSLTRNPDRVKLGNNLLVLFKLVTRRETVEDVAELNATSPATIRKRMERTRGYLLDGVDELLSDPADEAEAKRLTRLREVVCAMMLHRRQNNPSEA